MYSFYGGKQGRSYKITAHFDSISDMVSAFMYGDSYTDVGYDEYVIIDTIFKRNEKNNAENGIIYRRGYDFSQPFNPTEVPLNEDNSLNRQDLTKSAVTLYANAINTVYQKGALTSGSLSAAVKVPMFYNYSYQFTSANDVEIIITDQDFNTTEWNNTWQAFVEHPGGGAVYVGQIVGPEGDSPAVELIEWNTLRQYIQDEGSAEHIRGEFMTLPQPGYDINKIEENQTEGTINQDGYDHLGFHDNIQYGYCTLRDAQNNVTGAYLAFDIPYTVFNFEAASVSAYGDNGVTYNAVYDSNTHLWSYDGLISENSDSQEHPYYKHYNIKIPKGIHGRDINNLNLIDYNQSEYEKPTLPESWIDRTPDNAGVPNTWITYQYKDYNAEENPELSDPQPIYPYKIISNVEKIKKANTDGSIGTYTYQNTSVSYSYPMSLKFSYTSGEPDNFPYQMIEKVWYQNEQYLTLNKSHVYVQLSSGELVDCGVLKQIDNIEKINENWYVNYNDNTTQLFPIAEIEDVAFDGDVFLIRFKNFTSDLQNYTYNNKDWINLGSVVKGLHVYGNYASVNELPQGGFTEASGTHPGWVATVGDDITGYKLYAFNYRTNAWYAIQDLGQNIIDPQTSVIVCEPSAADNNIPVIGSNTLNNDGVWFVVTE